MLLRILSLLSLFLLAVLACVYLPELAWGVLWPDDGSGESLRRVCRATVARQEAKNRGVPYEEWHDFDRLDYENAKRNLGERVETVTSGE